MYYPTNILLLFTHASYYIPWELRPYLSAEFVKNDSRLLKNFSDFATAFLVPDGFPEQQCVMCWFSRAVGDPNRPADHPNLFREVDFNSNRVWERPLGERGRAYLWERYHKPYHEMIAHRIQEMERKHNRIVILDIHDTGTLLLGRGRHSDRVREGFIPEVCLGNLDDSSSSPSFIKYLSDAFKKEFGVMPWLNQPFKGGHVTSSYGAGYPNREVVQVEMRRNLYVDEGSQQIIRSSVKSVRQKMGRVIRSLQQPYDGE